MEKKSNQIQDEGSESQSSKVTELINTHCYVMEKVINGCCTVIEQVLAGEKMSTIETAGFNPSGPEPALVEESKPFILTNAVILSREIYNKIIDRAEKELEK